MYGEVREHDPNYKNYSVVNPFRLLQLCNKLLRVSILGLSFIT
jgi:hypothetical protein